MKKIKKKDYANIVSENLDIPVISITPHRIIRVIQSLSTNFKNDPYAGIRYPRDIKRKLEKVLNSAKDIAAQVPAVLYDDLKTPERLNFKDEQEYFPFLSNFTPLQTIKFIVEHPEYEPSSDKGEILAGVFLYLYYEVEPEILEIRQLERMDLSKLNPVFSVPIARLTYPLYSFYDIANILNVQPYIVSRYWHNTLDLRKYELYEAYLPIEYRYL